MITNLKLKLRSEYDSEKWDNQVSLLGGEFFHCHASAIYRAKLIGGQTLFFDAQDRTGNCVGVAVGVIATPKTWPLSRYSRIVSFAATPIANGNIEIESWILEQIEQKLEKMGVFRIEFDSYHSRNSNDLLPKHGYDIIMRHEYEFNLKLEIDELFAAISSTKRKHYRKAENGGVTTREVEGFEAVKLVEHFRDLAMDRRALSRAKKDNRVIEARQGLFSSGHTRVLVSDLNEEPVGACIFGVFNNRVYAFRSGSSNIGNDCYSPVHLYWSAVNLFKNEGYCSLGLGGAKENEAGIRKFKQMLGTDESIQPSGSKILSVFGAKLDALRKKLRH